MQPEAASAAVKAGLSLYEAGGLALLLLALIAGIVWLVGRFLFGLIKDLGARLNAVQDNQTGLLVGVVKECTAASREMRQELSHQTLIIAQQTEALRGRPCLVESGIHLRPAALPPLRST